MKNLAVNQLELDASSEMVSWFIKDVKAPLRMLERSVGSHRYFQCSSGFENDGDFVSACGRGQTKIEAAVRCIGEYLERRAAFGFFRDRPTHVQASMLSADSGVQKSSENLTSIPLINREFWTTNGWAVHTVLDDAIRAATEEALERHLLTSSFLRWGWQGFIQIGDTRTENFHFLSCISRFKTKTHSAGFAIGKKLGVVGASFGHFSDKTNRIRQSDKWAHALYESVDKLTPDFSAKDMKDPIAVDVNWYLSNSFPMDLASQMIRQEEIDCPSMYVFTQDLAKIWKLPFPLFSAYVFGGELMPLFTPHMLSEQGREYVRSQAKHLDFEVSWPDRIPVL